MKLLKLYNWFAGSKSDFIESFRENEKLYMQAKNFWDKLDNLSIFIFLIFIVLGISIAAYYYKPYNDKPGRHYTLGHWVFFLFVTLIFVFVVTFGFEYFAVKPTIKGATWLEAKIAICNGLYAVVIYFFTSLAWCNSNLPTNACRIFKK